MTRWISPKTKDIFDLKELSEFNDKEFDYYLKRIGEYKLSFQMEIYNEAKKRNLPPFNIL